MTVPLKGGSPTPVTTDATNHLHPVYSPDGTKIVCSAFDPDCFCFQLYTVAAGGGIPTEVTGATGTSPDWGTAG